MGGRAFVDTNVFVYLFDAKDERKRARARETLQWMELGDLVVSTQVLQEFYSTVTRKFGLPPMIATGALASLARNPVVVVDPPMVLAAASRSMSAQLNFWDALIVEAALSAGCDRLLSEDFQDGRSFGPLRVENPFVP